MSANPFIYFGGDSNMSGFELADDTLQCWKDIFGTYQAEPDFKDRVETKRINHLYYIEFIQAQWKEMERWTREQFQDYQRCQRDRHWTTIVCDKHGIKHHNDGLQGSSQEAMLHRAILSFDKFERAGNVPTLAIIQLTDPGRVTIYTEAQEGVLSKGFDRSFIINFDPRHANLRNNAVAIQQYCLAHMDVESNIGNIIRWLTTLAITNSFFKEKTGRYPIYVGNRMNSTQFVNSASNNESVSSSPGYQSLVTQSRVHTVNHNIWNLSQGRTDNSMCPGGHHTPQTHANFAQFIAPHLLQELNNGS